MLLHMRGTACWIILFASLLLGSVCDAQRGGSPEQECPGVAGGVCGKECQVHLCKNMAAFYNVTLNATDPWDNEDGWELTTTTPCEQLVAAAAPGRQAVYCSWFGVSCCTPSAVAVGNCSTINSIVGIRMPINNLNASVATTEIVKPLQKIHDCGLTVLDLEANNLVGQLSEAWGGLVNLKVFNFGNCWIEGRIPDSLRNLKNLTLINISNNWLNGTLPTWLDQLEQLRVLNLGSQFGDNKDRDGELGLVGTVPKQISKLRELRELNLEANTLTGTLPDDLCNGDNSTLLVLNVRGNQLEGNASIVESCGNLVQLDISNNHFEGPLPASADWDELATYRAGHNHFTGPFPVTLATHGRILEHLDVSINQLTGKFPNQITILSGLKSLDIAGNKFVGTLTEDVYYLPALMTIDISNNSFVGTIPGAIGSAYSLKIADFSNNPGLTGPIPPQIGLLEDLQTIRMQNTSLSCSGITKPYTISTNNSCSDPARCTTPRVYNVSGAANICTPEEQLPCCLKFADYLVPRDDSSNMRCRNILRRTLEDAVDSCSGSLPTDLDYQAELLPDISPEAYDQSWFVDPAYYQFQACECLMGYKAFWDEHHTVLTCVPDDESGFAGYKRTAVIVGSVAAVVVVFLCLLVWRQYLSTRPRWLRERIMQQKRNNGAPKCLKAGEKVSVSIVVTDVNEFSELTRRCPELMNKAMGGHNNILRKACHAHAGYVMDQEGDSWTVAFHDAEDAVAFSLQVQQALGQKVWGMRLGSSEAALAELRNMTSLRDEGFSTKYSSTVMHASTTASTPMRPHSSESSCNERVAAAAAQAAAAAAAAASLQQVVLQGESGINELRANRAGPSFSSNSWPRGSSTSSQSDLNQLVQPTNSIDPGAAAHSKVLAGLWLGKLGKGDVMQRPEPTLSFTDTNGTTDTGLQQHEQQNGQLPNGQLPQHLVTAAVMESGGSWESAQAAAALTAPLPSLKSSYGSGVNYLAPDRMASATLSRRPSDDRGSSRIWSAGAALMRRFSQFGRSGISFGAKSGQLTSDQQTVQVLRLAIRIGIATGPLPYNCDVSNCAVKDWAKELVSDVANGGQVLMDEATFRHIKDCLSVLGTVNERGYDDKMLQQLMHAQVVNRFQRHMGCNTCIRHTRETSFTSEIIDREAQDYDNDAVVVHMGCFEVPASHVAEESNSKNNSGSLHGGESTSPPRQLELAVEGSRVRSASPLDKQLSGKQQKQQNQQLQLYSVAAPGMRRHAENTQELVRMLAWTEAVNAKPGWVQAQKGYFDAPGARQMDLTAGSPFSHSQTPLPDVTIVFACVAGASGFTFKRNRNETHQINKVIRRCMLQQLAALPGGDGYLCRCQEADLKYMIAFQQPHRAVQWCLAVQEALMYMPWPAHVLSHPGFEEVLHPDTGLPIFRGPRLRMGLAEGQPNSVLPDHAGRANYYGGSVNRAARYMDATAHGGQVVTDLELLCKLVKVWAAQDREDSAAATTAGSNVQDEFAAAEAGSLPQQQSMPQQQQQQGQQQQRQQQQRQLPPLPPSSVAGSEVGVLPVWGRIKRQQHLSADHLDEDVGGFLEPAHRSRSETYARHGAEHRVTFNLGPRFAHLPQQQQQQQQQQASQRQLQVRGSSNSFTYGTSLDMQSPVVLLPPTSLSELPESSLSPGGPAAAAHSEAVVTSHLGTFTFKGSGEYEMVHILHASLTARTFPGEPPKGKGRRVTASCGPVEGLEDVQLQLPQCLLAARQAYSSSGTLMRASLGPTVNAGHDT